ncbi:AAA family ATPase [Arthrobacter sp. H35-D1]|uniref:AAA family ATPase n=1 Tax=Arthrobacter sp. H35-D1 TaxID=3046202 RepID=UPI0024BBE24A|nr:AAA family ATPase [Arthrobacter sp. H35-D1]MDJ0311677.1 AAA family ATPase [Arthrobacter sp. H35-D1]
MTDDYAQPPEEHWKAKEAEDDKHGRAILKPRKLSDIKAPPPTQWLAKGWIPYSEITVLVGEEGLGKSLAWVRWAAAITSGRADASVSLPARKPRDVVVIVTEDNPGEVKARLTLAGADLNHIYLFSSEADGTGNPVFGNAMNGDMATLDAYLEEGAIDAALVVVDAWVDTVAGSLTLKDSQQARQAMHPWKMLAQRHRLAVILMTHTNRMSTASTRDLMGSTAVLRQKARMVLFAARSPDDKESGGEFVWIGPDKSNVTGKANAVKYRLKIENVREASDDDPGTTACLANYTRAHTNISNLIAEWKEQQDQALRPKSKQEQAQEAVTAYMEDHPDGCSVDDLKDHLEAEGFGKTASEKARSALGTSIRDGFGGGFTFRLNNGSNLPSQDPIYQEVRDIRTVREIEPECAVNVPNLPNPPTSLTNGDPLGTLELCIACGDPLHEHEHDRHQGCAA